MDPVSGRIRLDRRLFTSTRYPADYGFVPGTLAEDGDPLDAMVLLGEPAFPGCAVTVRPVGVFWMTDEGGPDAKVLTVLAGDSRYAAAAEEVITAAQARAQGPAPNVPPKVTVTHPGSRALPQPAGIVPWPLGSRRVSSRR